MKKLVNPIVATALCALTLAVGSTPKAHAQQTQPEMDGGGAAGQRDRRQPHLGLKVPLERGNVGAYCREPVGGEGLVNVGLFSAAHVGDGEQDA